MKKVFLKSIAICSLLILVFGILNITVTTRQGINYKVRLIRLPLYLKLLDYLNRHYNYKNITVNIIGGTRDQNAKAIKILHWVNAHLRKQPVELPVIDDHPLNILIRGYGENDQFEDIFTVLCTYAGMGAFYREFINNSGRHYFISFVKINGRWCPLSAYGQVYVYQREQIISVEELLLKPEWLKPFSGRVENFEVESFLREINKMDFKAPNFRAGGQSPVWRIKYAVKELLSKGR